MGKKTTKKMDLGDFLADESIGGGSWADDEVDMAAVGLPIGNTTAAPIGAQAPGTGAPTSRFNDRPERKEYPIPDKPPYVARVANLPWEVNENDVKKHLEERTQMPGSITDVRLPMDIGSGKPKGFAIVTFSQRDELEEVLNLNYTEFNGRKIFVNVAAPPRQSDMDGEWKRGGSLGGRDREEVELDWGSARNSRATLPPRERRPFTGDRPERERKPEPELDWNVRGSALPERERSERSERPRRQEPEFDWGVRGTTLPPRERPARVPKDNGPELDWGASRGQGLPPRRESSMRKKPEPEFDWSRGNTLPPREKSNRAPKKDLLDWSRGKKDESKENAPRQSKFSVLMQDDEELTDKVEGLSVE